MVKNKVVTIIIPCWNEEKYIGQCLESIIVSDYPKETLEVLVVDGMSNDKTQEIVKIFASKFPFISLLINEKKTVPYALNLGIQHAKGNYIFILGAHSFYPKDYIKTLVHWSEKLGADVVGSSSITEVVNKNKKSNSIKAVMSDILGVGDSMFRVGADSVREVDTVAFGCYRREVFQKYGYFDTRLTRNQDIEFNKRIKNNLGKIFLIPFTKFTYYARENFKDIADNSFKNGMWNILTAVFTRNLRSLSMRHFVPLLFILSLIAPIFFSFWQPQLALISGFLFLLYLLIIFLRSIQLKNPQNEIYHLMASYIVLHFSYGFGSLYGLAKIFRILMKKERS